jgi:hypothetical protein
MYISYPELIIDRFSIWWRMVLVITKNTELSERPYVKQVPYVCNGPTGTIMSLMTDPPTL